MKPNPRFYGLRKEFWANVRLLSQQIGYTQRQPRPALTAAEVHLAGAKVAASIKVPTTNEVKEALENLGMNGRHLMSSRGALTKRGKLVCEYFQYRADSLNQIVQPTFMDKTSARALFEQLRLQLCPKCPLPFNKQKGDKKAPAFFTGIVNMLIESSAQGLPCDFDPRELTTFTRNGEPFRTLARRIDGAFPSPVNPIAVWEIKEYYYTTTFGSRVADGVYESLLDGLEIEELRSQGVDVRHYLMVDDHFTWWVCGRSYLCRIIDMLHMGYVDEVLFGREVIDRLPAIVNEWVNEYQRRRSASPVVPASMK